MIKNKQKGNYASLLFDDVTAVGGKVFVLAAEIKCNDFLGKRKKTFSRDAIIKTRSEILLESSI